MKKAIIILISITLLLSGCSAAPSKEKTHEKLQVLTTIFPPYDFVRQIAGDKVDLKMLLPIGGESHGYEPTLTDLSNIQKSDLFLYVGDDSDAWIDKLDQSKYNTDMLSINDIAGLSEEQKHESEHLWTSIKNSVKIVTGISAELCKRDPKNAEFYKDNTKAYLEELNSLDEAFAQAVSNAPLKTIIFAERFPFTCFAEDYGLEWQAAFDHCSSDFEPKIDVINNLVKTVNTKNISTVFYIEFSNQAVADTICAATGCSKALFHSCHNVTEEEWKSGATYFSLMSNNLEQLRKALQYAS